MAFPTMSLRHSESEPGGSSGRVKAETVLSTCKMLCSFQDIFAVLSHLIPSKLGGMGSSCTVISFMGERWKNKPNGSKSHPGG